MNLTQQLPTIAQKLNIELAMLQAVMKIEARSSGFINDLPVILFERHIFYKKLKNQGLEVDNLSMQLSFDYQ